MKKTLLMVFILLFLVAGAVFGIQWVKTREAAKQAYLSQMALVYHDEGRSNSGLFIVFDNSPMIQLEWLKENGLIDFRYSDSKKRILFSVDQDQIRYSDNQTRHYLRNTAFEVNLPILVADAGEYVDLEALARFKDLKYRYDESNGRLVIDSKAFKHYEGRVVQSGASLKMTASLKGQTLAELQGYDAVRIFKETEKAYRVRLENGLVGYVDKTSIDSVDELLEAPYGSVVKAVPFKKYYAFSLVWDQIDDYADTVASRPKERLAGLQVISPTWFKLTNEGWVLNDADVRYVEHAKALGYAVWPLFSNDFDPELTHGMLSSEKLRRKVIAQLVQYAGIYGVDGINLDFENVYLADQGLMTAFIQELSLEAKRNGLVFSVDATVPWGSDQWSRFLDRKAIEPYIDYLMLMAYDEHWASSPVAGSVASLPWVEKGISETLKLIPKEKLVLGIPLYTRVWTETVVDGKVETSSKTLTIRNVDDVLGQYLHLMIWDDKAGQNYIQYQDKGLQKKVWLEDEKSIELKLKLLRDYELAGVAGWRLGFEAPWLWTLLEKMVR